MSIEKMIELVDEISYFLNETRETKKSFEEKLKPHLTDRSIPLTDRWKAFQDSDLGLINAYIVRFDTIKEGKFKSWARNPIQDYLEDGRDRGADVCVFDMEESLLSFME